MTFRSNIRRRTFRCVVMDSAVLFRLRSILLIYSAWSGVIRVQVVLSGFSVRLLCFVKAKTVCRYGRMYLFTALVLVCIYVMVMESALATNCTGALGGGKSEV